MWIKKKDKPALFYSCLILFWKNDWKTSNNKITVNQQVRFFVFKFYSCELDVNDISGVLLNYSIVLPYFFKMNFIKA